MQTYIMPRLDVKWQEHKRTTLLDVHKAMLSHRYNNADYMVEYTPDDTDNVTGILVKGSQFDLTNIAVLTDLGYRVAVDIDQGEILWFSSDQELDEVIVRSSGDYFYMTAAQFQMFYHTTAHWMNY